MSNPSIDIPNLLYRYADFIDAGDFDGAARLFANAEVYFDDGDAVREENEMVAVWKSWVKLYEGRPKTRHLISNPIIELSGNQQTASCQSQWTVLQATDDLPLQAIGTGRYEDTFAIVDGMWTFKTRRYAGIDLIGDMSQHVMQQVKEKAL